LVVDLMLQVMSLFSKASLMAWASMVLPVPGSPLISRGFCRATAMFTLRISSSDTT
jgi:hypothetical protein